MKEPEQQWRRKEGEPFRPTAAWLAAFREQMTKALLDKLEGFAEPCAYSVAMAGARIDIHDYVKDVVADAVRKVREGEITWEHDRFPLDAILINTIWSRTRHDRVRAERRPHHAIGDDTISSKSAEDNASIAVGRGQSHPATALLCKEIVALLRANAPSDRGIQRLLDGYVVHGATCKAEVCAAIGMAESEYHKARIRLNRLIHRLGLSRLEKSAA